MTEEYRKLPSNHPNLQRSQGRFHRLTAHHWQRWAAQRRKGANATRVWRQKLHMSRGQIRQKQARFLGGFDGSMVDFCIKPFEICLYIFCSSFMSFPLNSSLWIGEFFSVCAKFNYRSSCVRRGQIFQGLEVHKWDGGQVEEDGC